MVCGSQKPAYKKLQSNLPTINLSLGNHRFTMTDEQGLLPIGTKVNDDREVQVSTTILHDIEMLTKDVNVLKAEIIRSVENVQIQEKNTILMNIKLEIVRAALIDELVKYEKLVEENATNLKAA